MNYKNIIVILVVITIIVFIFPFTTKAFFNLNSLETKTIDLGIITGLSGGTTTFGQPALNAAQLAIDQINLDGGINGKKINLIVEDGRCDNKMAVDATSKLININKVPLIYTVCSNVTLSTSEIANKNKVITFGTIATSPDISFAGDYVFRISPIDTKGTELLAKYIYDQGYKNIAILSAQDSYTLSVKKDFEIIFKKIGGKIIFSDLFDVDKTDFKTELTKIKKSDVDAVLFLPVKGLNSIAFLEQLDIFIPNIPLFSTRALVNKDVLDSVPNLLEDVIYADVKFNQKDKAFLNFLKDYKEKYGADPTYSLQMIAGVYDAVNITANALDNCGSNNTDCIRDYFYTMNTYNGVSGNISFDQYGDPTMDFELNIVKNGNINNIN
jgi:branched-chain amino acid transport system substrate-binding protein